MTENHGSLHGMIFRRNPDLTGATIDDELVMMGVEHGQYYGLTGVGPRVWELIEKPLTFNELLARILDEFEVELEVCEKDLAEFLKQMQHLGLVKRS